MAISSVSEVLWASITSVCEVSTSNIGSVREIDAPVAAGGIEFRSVAENYSTGTTSITINKPSGTIEGDLMVAIIDVNVISSIPTPPSGWNLKQSDSVSTGGVFEIYYKVAGGSEPSDYTWSWSGSQRAGGSIATFIGSFDADPQEGAFNFEEDNTSATVTSISLTHTGSVMVIYLSGYDQAAGGVWSQSTSSFTDATANDGSNNTYIGYQLFTGPISTGDADYSVAGGSSASADKGSYLWAFIENI